MTTISPFSLSLPYRTENRRFSTLSCTKTGSTQPKLSAACFVVQSCLADADFVVFSNYCLIGTRRIGALLSGFFRRLWLSIKHRTPIDAPYKQSSPNVEAESGVKETGTTAPVDSAEAGKVGEATPQNQELMKAFLARAGKGEDRLADDFDFLKLKAMYVLLKDVGYTIRLKPVTAPPSPAYQRGDGQEAGSKIEPVPVTESAECSNAA